MRRPGRWRRYKRPGTRHRHCPQGLGPFQQGGHPVLALIIDGQKPQEYISINKPGIHSRLFRSSMMNLPTASVSLSRGSALPRKPSKLMISGAGRLTISPSLTSIRTRSRGLMPTVRQAAAGRGIWLFDETVETVMDKSFTFFKILY